MVLASLLAIVCLATRPPSEPGIQIGDAVAPRWIIAGPLVGGLAIISSTGFDEIGISEVDLSGLVLLVAVAAIILNRWLPVVPAVTRRLLVLPFMLVAGSLFSGLAAAMLETLAVDAVLGASARRNGGSPRSFSSSSSGASARSMRCSSSHPASWPIRRTPACAGCFDSRSFSPPP